MPGRIYSVEELNKYIKNMFAQDYLLKSVSVQGEVSNCKYHTSGHIYFTLKDAGGTMQCVMWGSNASKLRFRMQEGMKVVVTGYMDVYEPQGTYKLIARSIRQEGAGELYERFERLKAQLQELGVFDECYKKPIPKGVRKLGVVTAEGGAALQDIINVSKRRNPGIEIVVYPAQVQGNGAEHTIVRGIETLDSMDLDVIIVGRGGGSIEDLWAFNTEEVAMATFHAYTPIISAVGHQTDFTIIDFVADHRAPTPSAAAELAVEDVNALLEHLVDLQERLEMDIRNVLWHKRDAIASFAHRIAMQNPEQKVKRKKEALKLFEHKMQSGMERKLSNRKRDFLVYAEKMNGLSPLRKLSSGFSYVENETGDNIRSVTQVRVGERMVINVTDGQIAASVEEIHTNGGQ